VLNCVLNILLRNSRSSNCVLATRIRYRILRCKRFALLEICVNRKRLFLAGRSRFALVYSASALNEYEYLLCVLVLVLTPCSSQLGNNMILPVSGITSNTSGA
jgi:hypothetical protein